MKLEYIKRGALEYALIRDVYSAGEVVKIKQEIVALRHKARVNSTGPAQDLLGRSLNYADSMWVDIEYEDREKSNILTLNRKLFTSDISEQLAQHSAYFAHIRHSTRDSTLLNFYTSGAEYKKHRDQSIFTALTFFRFGDFTGGQLEFSDFDEWVEPEENTMVIFAGCIKHHAHKVNAESEHCFRASMAQFINYANI